MSASQQSFPCVCGNSYNTLSSLRQHQRRYCRGQPSTAEDNRCAICGETFRGYAGVKQHMRHKHPVEYNDEMRRESVNARCLWTDDEENELAKREAECEPNLPQGAILDYLIQYSTRSKESIRARRRQASYIEKVRVFRQQGTGVQSSSNIGEEVIENDIYENENELRSALLNLQEKLSIAVDLHLLETILYQSKDVAINKLEEWCESLLSRYQRSRPNLSRRRTTPRVNLIKSINREGLSRRKKRALEYRLAQMDYRRDLKSYANRILDGTNTLEEETIIPNIEDLKNHYTEVFTTPSTEDLEAIADRTIDVSNISSPILEDEIELAIQSSKSSAPGHDTASLKDIRRIPKQRLSLLYNAMLLLMKIPRVFRKSRTLLIPKTIDNLQVITNWRPITISSIFLRIFNKIIAFRMTNTIDLNGAQRGFTKIDGCFANCLTLETIIKTRRKNGQPMCMISLDLSKAFDRVSHQSIRRGLTRKNVDKRTINLIMENYKEATTEISCNGNNIGEYTISRGVKQGDPLSPMLFNIILDELLCGLEGKGGIMVGDTKLSALAYADDIILCADNANDARRLLSTTIDFIKRRGLKLNVEKCHSLSLKTVPSKKKLYVDTEPQFKVNDEYINPLNIQDELRYLGQYFSYQGLTKCSTAQLYSQLTSIRRAPLKPQQKLYIVKTYLIPRYISSLQKPNISIKIMKEVDKKIRAFIRAILHLNEHCSNSIFYAPLKAGGLGIFNFQNMIPIISLHRIEKLQEASPLLRNTVTLARDIKERIDRVVGSEYRNTLDVKKKLGDELHCCYNGKGLMESKNHQTCNNFVTHPPTYWNGENFIKAIQLRYNLLPTVGIPSNPPEARLCRAGCRKVESLSHVLQNCPMSHWQRINRHNFVLKRLSDAARNHRWQVYIEPHIRCRDGLLKKPDAILIKGNTLIVTDVGINWEGDIPLTAQHENKVAIYSGQGFIDRLKELYPGKTINIMPLIVGARGTWCSRNEHLIKLLQLNMKEVENIILTTLRGGVMIHSNFMRTVWRNRASHGRR